MQPSPSQPPRPESSSRGSRAAVLERRAHRRVPVDVEVDWRSGHNFFTTRMRDISSGGLFLQTAEALAIGDTLAVRIHLLKKTFWIRGRVAWLLESAAGDPEGVGLEFVELDEAARRTIAAFTSLRAPMPVDWPELEEAAPG